MIHRLFFSVFLLFHLNSFSQTEAVFNREAYEKFEEADKRLNEVCRAILDIYSSDTLFIQNFKESQQIWTQFREAEMHMKYPAYSSETVDSLQPFCYSHHKRELTERRIETLIEWVIGIEEGYICNGTIRLFEDFLPGDMQFAHVGKDSTIWISVNMRKTHRIFGYAETNVHAQKKILLSIYTIDVAHNPFHCTYGAYYETSEMQDLSLKYLRTEGDFLEVAILKNQKVIDRVYMLKKWFLFTER